MKYDSLFLFSVAYLNMFQTVRLQPDNKNHIQYIPTIFINMTATHSFNQSCSFLFLKLHQKW